MTKSLTIEQMFKEMGLASDESRKQFKDLEEITKMGCQSDDKAEDISIKIVSSSKKEEDIKYAELA